MIRILILLLLPFFGKTSDINCNDLKEGLFKLESIDGSLHIIVRTKDKQTENVGRTGLVTEFDIKWISNCTYLLYNPRVVKGKDDLPDDLIIDTLYNEITEVNGAMHKVISSIKGYDDKIESILTKIDTGLLYRNITELEKFKDYNGTAWAGTLIGDNHSVSYRQSSTKKTDFVIAFEEALTIDHRAKYKLLDHRIFKLHADQKIATTNCRYDDKYDKEIVAIYTSKNDREEAIIIKAWRFNRLTLKIEDIGVSKVKYTVADKNLFLWDK